ncbi:MAG TPA: hypothetical protein VF068_14510 [Rubrobacter sp.]
MNEYQENRPEGDGVLRTSKKAGRTRGLGIALLVAALVFWVAVPAILLIPLSGEVAFWAAALVLGREVFRRYRTFLDPRSWFDEKPR